MKRLTLLCLLTGFLLNTLFAQVVVNTNITANTTWTNDNIYLLQGGCLFVTDNAILTIEPGTIIKGDQSALVITRGSKIIAEGTPEQPIVFTSYKPVGQRIAGDWGGLLIAGNAPINTPGGQAFFEGGCDEILGSYGGTDPNDNSGILKYVRIEYAGIPFFPNNELNSLTMGGVGAGTIIEHVQTSFGQDDAFEWFGGTVNGKYLVVYKTLDDMFDTDFGYSGNNQFVLGVSEPSIADVSGSNGFESDNDGQGSTNTPITDATFSNVSIFGPKQDASITINTNYRRGAHIRRSSKQDIVNSVLTGFPSGLRIESANSINDFLNDNLLFKNNIMAGFTTLVDSTSVDYQTVLAKFNASNNTVLSLSTDVLATNPYDDHNPDFRPAPGSPMLTGADYTGMNAFFETVAHKGAFGADNWAACWCEWDPDNADYDNGPINYMPVAPVIAAADNTSVCAGETVTLEGPAGFASYLWSNGETTQNITVSQTGDYSLVVQNTRGCQATSNTVNVTVNPVPETVFSYTNDGLTVFFTNSSTGATTYSWDFGDGETSSISNSNHIYASGGDYTVCLTATSSAGCVTEYCSEITGLTGPATIIVDGNITQNTTWTNNNIYNLQGGCLFVTNDAVLTIEPGTVIKGNQSSLVISRGSKIIAEGTATRPIVFTSIKPAGQRAAGDWGGILIAGKAPINTPGGEAFFEGGCDETLGTYGGTDPNDNSGILKYVRIEFAGIPFFPNNELNSLTMGGVGAGTVIEHVQTSFGQDDAFEWFGGTVNGKYLVVYKTLDDMFDTDFGYSGKNQFVLGVSEPNIADISGSNGFESDNDGQGSTNPPLTDATFSNVSIFGPKQSASTTINTNYRRGAHIRRSSRQDIVNSVITGFPTGLRLESANTINDFLNDNLLFRNNILAGHTTLIDSTSTDYASVVNKFNNSNNTVLSLSTDVQANDPYNALSPDYLPAPGSPMLEGADFTGLDNYFDPVPFRGAFGAENWTSCWCEWDPQNANYENSINYGLGSGFTFNTDGTTTVTFAGETSGAVSYAWDFGDGNVSEDANPTHTYDGFGTFDVTLTVTSSRGCTEITTSQVDVLTSSDNIWNEGPVRLYPNPFNESAILELNMNNGGNAVITIFDMTGRMVNQSAVKLTQGENQVSINANSMVTGIYQLLINTESGYKVINFNIAR